MVTATEHLELFRIVFLASRTLYPSAYFTLLRSAVMGSAQAIWVLRASPRTKRVENALRLVRDDLKQRKGMLQERSATIDLDVGELEGARDCLAEWLGWVQDAAGRIGLDRSAVPAWRSPLRVTPPESCSEANGLSTMECEQYTQVLNKA